MARMLSACKVHWPTAFSDGSTGIKSGILPSLCVCVFTWKEDYLRASQDKGYLPGELNGCCYKDQEVRKLRGALSLRLLCVTPFNHRGPACSGDQTHKLFHCGRECECCNGQPPSSLCTFSKWFIIQMPVCC